ncbi:MAG TPA: bifunctional phosphopantothenoylcysteine decarboxylase/phosphopantothenate--cysteine ligase CoaBC [Dehalococcoidia bacterium]|nr:bifunctional phosphopantothenoylcysteine decarboxylase/phosphopantothenate--cysteine ligase CoaBC [Dehalococcoidia bacterium]
MTPLTFRSLTHRAVSIDLFDPHSEESVEHVKIGERADAVVVVPAPIRLIAKLALGLADDVIGTTVLAAAGPVAVAPDLDERTAAHPRVRDHFDRLRENGYLVVEGDRPGALPEWPTLARALGEMIAPRRDLAGRCIVISAGGTQEPIDPVRFITNRSSGKMGYAIAEAARRRGARVTLVSAAPLPPPAGVEVVPVQSALEMREAILRAVGGADALIMAAAVADYRVNNPSGQKIKKGAGGLTLDLVKNPDILAEVNGRFLKVGFAAESNDLIANAREKLAKKNLDLIVANDITASDAGFAVDTNRVILIDRAGAVERLPLMLKSEVADQILDRVAALLEKR